MKVHYHVYFDECIPASFAAPDPDFFTKCEPTSFGKKDLMGLAHFWEERERKFRYKSHREVSPQKADDYAEEADLCETKRKLLLSIAARAQEKPPIFTKPIVHINERAAFFVEDPGRFLVGTLTRICVDEEAHTGSFTIRAYDRKTCKMENFTYEPDGISIFPESYLIYFCEDREYFKIYLDLHAWDTATQLKAERMLAALPAPLPPDVA